MSSTPASPPLSQEWKILLGFISERPRGATRLYSCARLHFRNCVSVLRELRAMEDAGLIQTMPYESPGKEIPWELTESGKASLLSQPPTYPSLPVNTEMPHSPLTHWAEDHVKSANEMIRHQAHHPVTALRLTGSGMMMLPDDEALIRCGISNRQEEVRDVRLERPDGDYPRWVLLPPEIPEDWAQRHVDAANEFVRQGKQHGVAVKMVRKGRVQELIQSRVLIDYSVPGHPLPPREAELHYVEMQDPKESNLFWRLLPEGMKSEPLALMESIMQESAAIRSKAKKSRPTS